MRVFLDKDFKRYFISYFILFGIGITVFTVTVGHLFHLNDIEKQLQLSAEEIGGRQVRITFAQTLDRMDQITSALHQNRLVQRIAVSPDPGAIAATENLFLAIAASDKQIMQLRFIDAKGMEVVRIDRDRETTEPYPIPRNKLQDKSGRDYFRILSAKKDESIWHSRLDLNIEHGAIEVPFRPTLRIGQPVQIHGKFMGVVIVNLLTGDLLDSISHSLFFEHYLIDSKGFFLIHPDTKYSWNRLTGILRNPEADFGEAGEWVLSDGSERKYKSVYRFDLSNILKNDDNAILVLKTKESYIDKLNFENLLISAIVILLSSLMSFPVAFLVSRAPIALQEALRKSYMELKDFADIIDTYVITLTAKADGIITSVSKAFCENCGYSHEELIDSDLSILNPAGARKNPFTGLWRIMEKGVPWKGELDNRKKTGEIYWLDCNVIPALVPDDGISSVTLIGNDITAKKELERITDLDKLTGLYNRRKLDDMALRYYRNALENETPLAVILLDLDHFKNINDTYGHQAGDMVLSETGSILLRNLRRNDCVGRYGGEEFLILCESATLDDAKQIAEKIRIEMENHPFPDIGQVTSSLGAAILQNGDTLKDLIHRADTALYKAKNSGRNQVIGIHT
jgi:diguanylate cyclase (GGDEF)-like protein/PAS domain S-box-containing protein